MHTYRTRFKKDIVAEFLPPLTRKKPKGDRIIIFCPGQPGGPSNRNLLEFFAKKGFWIFLIRYRGSWESGGKFLAKSPERDVLDIIDELVKKQSVTELSDHMRFAIRPAQFFVFGGSFGGPAAILASRDERVVKAVCISPVVDWKDHIRHGETIDWGARFTRDAFGMAYRPVSDAWKKLKSGKFYNPALHAEEIDGKKLLLIHAKDDNVVRFGPVAKFAKKTGAKLVTLKRGGHGSSSWFAKPRFYKKIARFLKSR
jgi:pimeloyl-ACP methyl ester carboxylesterase